MPRPIEIESCTLGPAHPPFVVAELSGNHMGSLERAHALVDAVADAGVDAVKLQTYTADTMTLDVDAPGFRIEDEGTLWDGESLHALYDRAHTPWAWHAELFAHARERGLVAFSSPFDATAVDFLEALDAPCYKVASFELVDLPLVRRVAATGKPVIVSTGMATEREVAEAVDAARGAGCRDLVLLQCTSAYPADASDAALATLPDLARRFACHAGLSDHSAGITVPVAATALGAVMVEKHVTLARDDGAVDSAFSLIPEEFAELVRETRRAHAALGEVRYGPAEGERDMLRFRRSLYFVADLPAGTTLTTEHVRAIRPGLGLAPKHLERVLGATLVRDVTRGTPVDPESFRVG